MSQSGKTTPFKHYLIEAALKCIEDDGLTPHLLCDTQIDGVVLPQHLKNDPNLTLSLSRFAIRDFALSVDGIGFSATFAGMPFSIYLPMQAVIAVFAKESGQGLVMAGDFNLAPLFETPQNEEAATSVASEDMEESSDKPALEEIPKSVNIAPISPKKSKTKKPSLQLVK